MRARGRPPGLPLRPHGTYFIVRDQTGQALAHLYYENDPGHRAASNPLTRHEARRIATKMAKLPELLKRPQY
jgi:hypothetical protein